MKTIFRFIEIIIVHFGLTALGFWKFFDFLEKHCVFKPKLATFYESTAPIIISFSFAFIYFWYKFYFLFFGYVHCKSFPGKKTCKHIYDYLTESNENIIKSKGPVGIKKKIIKEGTSSISYPADYDDYLSIIWILIRYSYKSINMTLPMSPYVQINDTDAYQVFIDALKTIRKRFLINGKQKIIVLSNKELDSFKNELALDFILNNPLKIKQYIRCHYGYEWISKCFGIRIFNCILKYIFHIHLKWKLGNQLEFLLIDKQMAILFYTKMKSNGCIDPDKSKIVIDLNTVDYERIMSGFENLMSTKDFFNNYILNDRQFYRYCAEYLLVNKEFIKDGRRKNDNDHEEFKRKRVYMENSDRINWNKNIAFIINKKQKIWKAEMKALIKLW